MPALNWTGKAAVVKPHKDVPFGRLEPDAALAPAGRGTGGAAMEGASEGSLVIAQEESENVRMDGLGSGFPFCRLSAAPLFGADGQASGPLRGLHEGRAMYLFCNGMPKDRSVDVKVLTGRVFEAFPDPKVICAVREGLTFKQMPDAPEV